MKNCGLNTGVLFAVRLVFSILMASFCVIFFATMSAAEKNPFKKPANQNNTSPTHWPNRNNKDYVTHVTSDVSEWLMVLCLLVFLATFVGEFKSVRMRIVVSRNTERTVPLAISADDSLTAPLLL